jgi:hypothetical protein
LSQISHSAQVIPSQIEFVDIAGLVAGASRGEGLGNQFLAHIRQVDAIVHVVRCFEDADIVHVAGSVDPVRDMQVISLELALADLAQIEKRLERVRKQAKSDKQGQIELTALEQIQAALDAGTSARQVQLEPEQELAIQPMGFLTRKKVIYAANVTESDLASGNAWVDQVRVVAEGEAAKVVVVSAQVEAELVDLPPADRQDYLNSLGVQEGGLKSLIRATYDLLGLRTYFTSGPKETRAWTIPVGATAPQSAGVIHSDFERGFIRAETVAYQDLVAAGSLNAAKEKGLLRSEGKDYIVQEGDVMHFRFNV